MLKFNSVAAQREKFFNHRLPKEEIVLHKIKWIPRDRTRDSMVEFSYSS